MQKFQFRTPEKKYYLHKVLVIVSVHKVLVNVSVHKVLYKKADREEVTKTKAKDVSYTELL